MTRVAAIVVTHNRHAVLAETLRAVQAQTRAPDRVYVIDNASVDGTADVLRKEFPEVVHLRMTENLGAAGGLAHGMETARSDGFDACWLMDDDSRPRPDALETVLRAADRGSERTGIVGCRGGIVRHGRVRHVDDLERLSGGLVAPDLFAVDFALFDGSLVLGSTIDVIGVPRRDFFMMMEEVDYSLRARRVGFEVLVVDRDLMRRDHLGSVPGSSLWRGYYQSRNHVRMALDFRSPSLLVGCLARQVRFVIAAVRAPDRRWERARLRGRGVWDGIRGRMGRTVEPDAVANP